MKIQYKGLLAVRNPNAAQGTGTVLYGNTPSKVMGNKMLDYSFEIYISWPHFDINIIINMFNNSSSYINAIYFHSSIFCLTSKAAPVMV
jgi:hypothetical protein